MRRMRSGCCARATSGQAAVVLARPAMKLRLLMGVAPGRRQYPSTSWNNYSAVRYRKSADLRFGSKADILGDSGHVRFTPKSRHSSALIECPALCHVWTAPSWQGKSARLQPWSVQPCVRPVCAVLMTAGHNALRGSGPGQLHAFDNALAKVGCRPPLHLTVWHPKLHIF